MEQRLANNWNMTVNERNFMESALLSDLRVDNRRRFDYRDLTIKFGREDGSSEVQLGDTHVMCIVTAQLVQPYRDRPNEGSLAIYVELSPMADPTFEAGRPGESAVELGRIIDRGLRESRAVDTESLCVLSGILVWSIRVDLLILDNGGNLVDAANIAALAALMTFRRPDCTPVGDSGLEVKVHPPDERPPLPLIVHHLPIAVTFAFITDSNIVVVDPTYREEAIMEGRMTVTLNANEDVCTIQKAGGVGIDQTVIMQCLQIAALRASDITDKIKDAVDSYRKQRADLNIKHLSILAALDINPPHSEIKWHVNQFTSKETESGQERDKFALQECASREPSHIKVQELSFSGRAAAINNKPKSSIRGPSCWDPCSKGVDSGLLKASLASRGIPVHCKENANIAERQPLESMASKSIKKMSPPQAPSASDAVFIVSEITTLKDAVKPKNKRKMGSASITS